MYGWLVGVAVGVGGGGGVLIKGFGGVEMGMGEWEGGVKMGEWRLGMGIGLRGKGRGEGRMFSTIFGIGMGVVSGNCQLACLRVGRKIGGFDTYGKG